MRRAKSDEGDPGRDRHAPPAERTLGALRPGPAMPRLARLGLVALLPLLLVACSRTAPPAPVAGQWQGAFTCAEGLIGLTLVIGEPLGTHVPATFSFYALPSNPAVPAGSFWMGGAFEGGDRLILSAGGWLEQPPGYELLDLDGTMSADRRTYSGVVTGSPDCTGFFVTRVD